MFLLVSELLNEFSKKNLSYLEIHFILKMGSLNFTHVSKKCDWFSDVHVPHSTFVVN